jgi:excisionase family DNA binding protein
MENITFDQLPNAVGQLFNKLEAIEGLLKAQGQSTQEQETDQILSVDQCAEFLNLSKATIYTLTSKGELPFMKRSKRNYFSKSDLVQYLKQGRNKTNSELEAEAQNHISKSRKK